MAEKGEKPCQDYDTATAAFFDESACNEPKAQSLGTPIPGYSGVNRRVQADNIFGMTYAEARRMAEESQDRIIVEKKETLKETSTWIPEHKR